MAATLKILYVGPTLMGIFNTARNNQVFMTLLPATAGTSGQRLAPCFNLLDKLGIIAFSVLSACLHFGGIELVE